MKIIPKLAGVLALSMALTSTAMAQDTAPLPKVLFTNANILDSNEGTITEGMSLLVEGNKIAQIAASIPAPEGATVIDANGRTLMPGLIDAHVHLTSLSSFTDMFYAQPDYIAARALVEAKATLMRGYTGVRDISGQVMGVRKSIDEGYFPGPRIWASGAGISMSAGHLDIKPTAQKPRGLGGWAWTDIDNVGMGILADGVPEVLAASRLQMRNGANFLKMYTSGAVSGMYDPLDIAEFSFDELKAAADEARRWNTYLAVHTYNNKGTQAALNAGAMSIEHANLLTEETVKLMAEKGAYLSAQTGAFLAPAPAFFTADQKVKKQAAADGLDTLFSLAKKYNVKIALGTDLPGNKEQQAYEMTNRLKWFTPAEIIQQATVNNAELMTWSGPRNPYPGKLGVIEEGALADLLLVDGNPLEELTLFNDPEKNLLLIMKDGKIYKNTVE